MVLSAMPSSSSFFEQAADLCVDHGDAGIVAVNQFTLQFFGERAFFWGVAVGSGFFAVVPCARVAVEREFLVGGQRSIVAVVEVPIFLRCDEGEMRLFEADAEEEGLVAFGELFEKFESAVADLSVFVAVVGNVGSVDGWFA